MDHGGDLHRRHVAPPDQDELDHLMAVSSGRVFENLSWRLLRLLVEGVRVEQRALGEGDVFKTSDRMDAVFVERGKLSLDGKEFPGGTMGILPRKGDGKSIFRETDTLEPATQYSADDGTVLRVFFKPDKPRGARREGRARESRWRWLCQRSVVARRALLAKRDALPEGEKKYWDRRTGEVVLLVSKDVVEYLPALTDLLAQAMADPVDQAEAPFKVCLLRYDSQAAGVSWDSADDVRPVPVCTVGPLANTAAPTVATTPAASLREEIEIARQKYDYVFVDLYDRAADLGAIPVRALASRARRPKRKGGEVQDQPGTTLLRKDIEDHLLRGHGDSPSTVDTLVHVARNFRVDPPDRDKLNFHAVVLDSRTARFEAGGTRDRQQRRSADEPVPAPVERHEPLDGRAPTTRLHLNLMRLKKAWEQSPSLEHVCDVLDEPNAPAAGDRRGYWKARDFFHRWVRDLRFRRIGVALGGGGATGFCHVALVQALRQQGVPIDLVSGTSFGALVGAYYCSLGLDGLKMLTEQAVLLTGVASLTVLTSALFEHLVNLSIDYRPMWELPIPFYAVATDIHAGTMAIFPGPAAANPSVGFAVRASGSLPGVFAPALAGDARYVDGSAVSNVPVLALIQMGADLVIGSNAFPFRRGDDAFKPTPLRAFLPPPFGQLAERALAELNPGNRMMDAARSLSLSLTEAMTREAKLASALYEHRRTDVKYWEFHRAGLVLRAAFADMESNDTIKTAWSAVRSLNKLP